MKKYRIKCYVKNKVVYHLELQMTEKTFFKQLRCKRLVYLDKDTGYSTILNIDNFDRIEINTLISISLDWDNK